MMNNDSIINRFWNTKTSREKGFLITGALAVIITLLYNFMYIPLQTKKIELESKIIDTQQLIDWIQEVKPQIKTPKRTIILKEVNLFSMLENEIKSLERKESKSTLSQRPQGEVAFNTRSVYFPDLMKFLLKLNQQGVLIKKVKIVRSDTEGTVQVSLLLVPPNRGQ